MSRVDVLIVTALKAEFDALLEVEAGLSSPWTKVEGEPPFWTATFGGSIRVAAARATTMGGVATTQVITQLNRQLSPRFLAMCGVCAGHPEETERGDVIISDRVFQHDRGKRKFSGFQGDLWVHTMTERWRYLAQELEGPAQNLPGYAEPDDEAAGWWLLDKLLFYDPLRSVGLRRYLPNERRAVILKQLENLGYISFVGGGFKLTEAGTEAIQRHHFLHGASVSTCPYHIHVGPMASGNAVEADGTIWERLATLSARKVLGIDMEAAAVGQIAHTEGMPFVVAKGVADHADAIKSDRFIPFAARSSAEVLLLFLRKAIETSVSPAAPVRSRTAQTKVRVSRLQLRNVRCFDELDVEFGRDGDPTDWTLVLGANGSGKSTLLRALALALSPGKELGTMLHADGEGWAGPAGPEGQIIITLSVDGVPQTRTLNLASTSRSTQFQQYGSTFLDTEPLLLAGYGAARQLLGTKELGSYSRYDSTSTLMSPNGSLQNPELAVRRAMAASDESGLLARLDRILLLEPGSTLLSSAGLLVRGPDGVTRPLTQLSDGFRGTLSWVLDLIGWRLMVADFYGLAEVPAIVIVDELEQHLHPQWQRAVIARLREQFPAVQFIVSTHAPLCVLGSTDLDDKDISLLHLDRGHDADGYTWIEARSGMRAPRDQRADQVLTSYLFGLSSARSREVDDKIHELSRLFSRASPTPDERARALELQRDLAPLLGSAETALEREIHRAALSAAEQAITREFGKIAPERRNHLVNLVQVDPSESGT